MPFRPSQRPSSVIVCCLVAFVLSAHFVACIDGDVRLVGSPRSIEGRVEVESIGVWGGICSDGWDLNDANVVCRQLGYTEGAMLAGSSSGFGFFGTSPLFLTELGCIGGEDRLSNCPGYQIQVDNSQGACDDAALVCQLPGYLGCFSGVLTWTELSNILQDVTIDRCIAACNARGSHRFARLSDGQICQCGSSPSFGTQVPADRCSVPCTGSSKQACGGLFDNRIFSYFPTLLGSTTGTYTSANGSIVSPNFPGFYKPGIDGVWTITYSSLREVRFSFDFIDLFMNDSLEIRSDDTTIRISHDENVLEYTLMGVQFEVTLSVDVNSPEANAGFFLRYTDLGAATPAPLNPPTQAEETTQATPTPTGSLFGIIAGAFVVLLLTAVIVACCLKKRRSAKSSPERDTGGGTSRPIGLTRLTASDHTVIVNQACQSSNDIIPDQDDTYASADHHAPHPDDTVYNVPADLSEPRGRGDNNPGGEGHQGSAFKPVGKEGKHDPDESGYMGYGSGEEATPKPYQPLGKPGTKPTTGTSSARTPNNLKNPGKVEIYDSSGYQQPGTPSSEAGDDRDYSQISERFYQDGYMVPNVLPNQDPENNAYDYVSSKY